MYMFDPTKLELDLDNLDNEVSSKKIEIESEKLNEQGSISSDKIFDYDLNQLSPNTTNLTTNDVLDGLDLSEISKFEEKNETIDMQDLIEVLNLPEKNETNIDNQIGDNENQKIELNEEVQIWRTEYEKNIISNPNKTEIKKEDEKEEKIIFDINLNSLEILLTILIEKQYDFATIEPGENYVKICFRKDKLIKETKIIKFPIYTNILFKAKSVTKLTIEENKEQQEWTWEIVIKDKNYKVITKVVPSNFWSKLFIKAKELEKKIVKNNTKKISISQIFIFLWIITFITLIIGGTFLWFVVINAQTVEDVNFFYSLWINLNDINNFLRQSITIIFSILIFIETLFLIIYLFKFFLTKKEFKQKKIRYWILWALILIITFSSASAWKIIYDKAASLPNWQEMSYWDIQIYDNSKLTSQSFEILDALIKDEDTSNLIGPVEIKYDLKYLSKSEERKWFKIKKYIWDFGDGNIKETPLPTIIYNFKEKRNYKVSLTIEVVDRQWKITEKQVQNIPNINIAYTVKINETKLSNGWKLVDFDASSLKELWKIEWYFLDDLTKPIWTNELFKVWKPIFEETIIWMYIRSNDKTSEVLDKIFTIWWWSETTLDWEIAHTISLENDLDIEFKVENVQNNFWDWYIVEYKWFIWDKTFTKEWDIINPEESSKINFTFKTYWEQKIKVILKNSIWEVKEISTTINIPKRISLSKWLIILDEWGEIKNLKYEKKVNEYYIDEIWVPTDFTLDARFLRADNILYTLKNVSWDYNSDWDIDEVNRIWNYYASVEWNHTITAHYEFVNRRIPDDIIKLTEKIYIEWIKKDAMLKIEITKNSAYAPVIVSFDASKSEVKNENIAKFIWDYWDWEIEERDAIVPWHRYIKAWEYEIKLKVITTSWKEYSTSQKLILQPRPQTAKITTSMKKAPTLQWINFSSKESEWQIVWYFWDFWDWNISTEANPTHSYNKIWKYKVTLKLDFVNKNILEDTTEIEITN